MVRKHRWVAVVGLFGFALFGAAGVVSQPFSQPFGSAHVTVADAQPFSQPFSQPFASPDGKIKTF
jgi:hypothetical protein